MKPVVAPGQVVVAGDTTFRTRENSAIDVSVKRTFQTHEATGTATLHGLTLDEAQHSGLVHVAAGRAWLAIADALADDPAAAYEAAQRGIADLGTDYRGAKGHHFMDDSGNMIVLAKMAAEQGDQAGAAQTLTKVLGDRVALYLRAFAGKVE